MLRKLLGLVLKHYVVIVINSLVARGTNRLMQCNRELRNSPIQVQPAFDKGSKAHSLSFQQMMLEQLIKADKNKKLNLTIWL